MYFQKIHHWENWRIKQHSSENKDAHGDKLEIYLDFFSHINTLWWVILTPLNALLTSINEQLLKIHKTSLSYLFS